MEASCCGVKSGVGSPLVWVLVESTSLPTDMREPGLPKAPPVFRSASLPTDVEEGVVKEIDFDDDVAILVIDFDVDVGLSDM